MKMTKTFIFIFSLVLVSSLKSRKSLLASKTKTSTNLLNKALNACISRGYDWLQIFVRLANGRKISINLEPGDNIECVKAKIQEKEGISPSRQRILFKGRPLQDSKTLADYNIQTGSTLDQL